MLREQLEGGRILDEEEFRVLKWQRGDLILGHTAHAGECRTMLDRSWRGLFAVDCDDESGAIELSAGMSSIFGGTSAQSMCKTSHYFFFLSFNTRLSLRSRSSIQSVIRKPYSSFSQPNITSSSSQSAVEPPPQRHHNGVRKVQDHV
jgi:hypothetical protein